MEPKNEAHRKAQVKAGTLLRTVRAVEAGCDVPYLERSTQRVQVPNI